VQIGFGTALKDWRRRRRMSQLDLGLAANVSARHIAFLETGRARPSRSMVLQLSQALEMPRQNRNEILMLAGFAAAYRATPLDETALAAPRAAVDWMLQQHAPYPAFAIDRHWTLVAVNAPVRALFAGSGIGAGTNLLGALVPGGSLRSAIVNWPLFARHVAARLRTESLHLGGAPDLDAAVRSLLADALPGQPAETGPLPPFAPTDIRHGTTVLSFLSTIAQFGTAEDMTIADLRIELMFPADEATRLVLLELAQQTGANRS
jgi:transcriptional regulator with XRE-family HTH domain